MTRFHLSTALSATIVLAIPACAIAQGEPNADFTPAFPEQVNAPALDATPFAVEEIASGLANPWGIALLPDGRFLVTERPGTMRIVGTDGALSEPLSGIPEVLSESQGGLLDVALSPEFDTDRMVYFTYSKPVEGGSVTAAARGILSEDESGLADVEDIFLQEPASDSPMHFGSRITFDQDGFVFVTLGERSIPETRVLAQDLDTTYGKVVRILPDGSIPDDNPFVGQDGLDSIWSYGHRNPQGAAIDAATGEYWLVEHGPAGGDELNRPEAGANYGWPIVSYGIEYRGGPIGEGIASAEDMEQPVYYWDPVIAPGGMLFYDGAAFSDWEGDVLIASLNPGALVRVTMEDGRVTGEERMLQDVGRIRDVALDADGHVLVITDDTDGQILRLSPEG